MRKHTVLSFQFLLHFQVAPLWPGAGSGWHFSINPFSGAFCPNASNNRCTRQTHFLPGLLFLLWDAAHFFGKISPCALQNTTIPHTIFKNITKDDQYDWMTSKIPAKWEEVRKPEASFSWSRITNCCININLAYSLPLLQEQAILRWNMSSIQTCWNL